MESLVLTCFCVSEAILLHQEKARRMFCVHEGDHLSLLNVYNAFIRVSAQVFMSYPPKYGHRWCICNVCMYISYKVLAGLKETD